MVYFFCINDKEVNPIPNNTSGTGSGTCSLVVFLLWPLLVLITGTNYAGYPLHGDTHYLIPIL
jgi:hypothetical protein